MHQGLPVYVINLDRRPDRRDYMAGQLAAAGLDWHRVSAVDAETASNAEIARHVVPEKAIIRMGRASQCNLLSHLEVFRRIAEGAAPAGLVLEDDVELSPEIGGFLQSADWVPPGIGIVRFEKWSRRVTRKLLGPPLGTSPVPGRSIHRLYSRVGGAGCYLLTREAARRLATESGRLRFPSDHLLFNLNLSPLARAIGVAQVCPALARQNWGQGNRSDIAPTTRSEQRSLFARLRRGWYEINLVPAQIRAGLFAGARLREIAYAERTA